MADRIAGGVNALENLHNDRFSSHAVVREGTDGKWYRLSLMAYTEGEAMTSARYANARFENQPRHSVIKLSNYSDSGYYIYPPEDFQ